MTVALIDGDITGMHISKCGYYVNNITRKYIHREIAERALGRKLKRSEQVHHVDGNKLNNINNNLVICPNMSYHRLLHARQRILEMGGSPEKQHYCTHHCVLHDKSEFSTTSSTWSGLHNMCRNATNEYRKAKGLNRNKFNWRERLNQQYRRILKSYTNRDISWISPGRNVQ